MNMIRSNPLKQLLVIRLSDMSGEEAALVATLQGVIAQKGLSIGIYIDPGAHSYQVWLEHLRKEYGIGVEYCSDAWELVSRFRDELRGSIIYRGGDRSINAATSLAGIRQAVIVDETIAHRAESIGLALVADVRDKDESWVLEQFGGELSKEIVFELNPDIRYHLRDYAVMTKALMFYAGNTPERKRLLGGVKQDAVVAGWGDAKKGEDVFVSESSKLGLHTLPADWAMNVSVFSRFMAKGLAQKPAKPAVPSVDKHFVTFLMTDGDNLQWALGGFQDDPKWFGSEKRGSFPMGWGLPPYLQDLAPSVLKWYYEQATPNDDFVVGPSGLGYMYPSRYPEQALRSHTARLNTLMGQVDQRIVQILDFDSFEHPSLWDAYTVHPNIDGLIYLDYSPYHKYGGRIRWSGGKPVIAAREMLWERIKGCDNESVIEHLNRAPVSPEHESGYSLVVVHAWSKTMDDVSQVIGSLAPHVEVVGPQQFVDLIKACVGRENE